MAYEPEKDKAINEEMIDVDGARIRAGVYSYNGGEKKIGFTRIVRKKDGMESFAALGRLKKGEAERVREALDRLIPLLS
ncbi:MAG: hypothetical protein HYT87_14150 [Nitrospirae bacterium]|nr:hypothetical protein [Nitrospirota bacterium]